MYATSWTSPSHLLYPFVTDFILSLTMTETNRYANHYLSKQAHKQSSQISEKPETNYHGRNKRNSGMYPEYKHCKETTLQILLVQSSQATPWPGRLFARHNFCYLLWFYHLVNNKALPGPTKHVQKVSFSYWPF
jgi:hypothetical protein